MKNNKGFTLVELLAVIVIIGLVVGITAYISINAINSARKKSYQVTINNIEKNASNYLLENSNNILFIPSDDDSEYQCVTVKELIELGYLKNDVTNSKVSSDEYVELEKYVYLERNANTKTITKTEYDYANALTETCITATNVLGSIQFSLNPSSNTWSQKKNVRAYYNVKNVTSEKANNLKYTYQFEDEEGNAISLNTACKSGCTDTSATKEFEVNIDNIYLHAYLIDGENIVADGTHKIDKIDNIKPQIDMLSYEKDTATGATKVSFKVIDSNSGINYQKNNQTFTKDALTIKKDLVNVNSNLLNLVLQTQEETLAIYELTINNSLDCEKISIDIAADKVYDNALNSNESKNFNISVNSTGKVNIKYSMNGGSFAETYGSGYSSNGDIITKNGAEVFHTIKYGQSLDADGLYNWNNSSHINLTKTGNSAVVRKEWCTNPDGSGTCYNQYDAYPASSFCDASAGDCTVTLYVNWEPKPLRIYYHQNDGTIGGYCRAGSGNKLPCKSRGGWAAVCEKSSCSSPSDYTYAYQLCAYDSTCNLLDYNNTSFLNVTRANYYAEPGKEWSALLADDSYHELNHSTDYTYNDLLLYAIKETDEYMYMYLYVNWVAKPIYIYYNTYGGNIEDTTSQDRYKKHTNSSGTSDNWVAYKSNNEYVIQTCEAGSTCNIWNYNGGGWKFSRENYNAPIGQEWWSRNSDGSYTYLNQATNYSYEAMAAAKYAERDTNIEVWLYVNWISSASDAPAAPANECYWTTSTECNGQLVGANCAGKYEEETKTCGSNNYSYRKRCKGTCYAKCKSWASSNIITTTWCPVIVKPGKPCFLAGTKIKTILGYKNIEDISIGDKVLSYNTKTGQNEYKEVINKYIHRSTTDDLYTLTIDNQELDVTSNHRFYIIRNNSATWIAAKDLVVGDKVMYSDSTHHLITNITYAAKNDTYYNFEVADNHNYYVTNNEILVHNYKSVPTEK